MKNMQNFFIMKNNLSTLKKKTKVNKMYSITQLFVLNGKICSSRFLFLELFFYNDNKRDCKD